MRKLVIYYSYEGNTRFVAQAIAKTISADILELKAVYDNNPTGLRKYIWGGKQVVEKFCPELEVFPIDPASYDLVVIGTPVWAFNYSPAIRALFKDVKLFGKQIAVFCCHAGLKGNTLANMKDALIGNTIVSEADFLDPFFVSRKKQEKKAVKWALKLVG
ncbi:MAG: flavodoxin [Candidatus Omnitrophica bacterium]|nr:flavodoxin [Candidatus Omnitrophota bacterium]